MNSYGFNSGIFKGMSDDDIKQLMRGIGARMRELEAERVVETTTAPPKPTLRLATLNGVAV